jgi:peptidoglycan/LPS O-acetylase OafA/YrhL
MTPTAPAPGATRGRRGDRVRAGHAAVRQDGFLVQIQALRALAVGLVVVFHLWPHSAFTGGFIGVDVFFVISGFLITGHLLRDSALPAGSYFGPFWVRRGIRILPPSLVMLLVAGIVGGIVLPRLHQPRHWSEMLASTLYVENLHLIASKSDYLTALDAPSVFQHAWSLSVEEQFYLLWPFLVFALVALAARRAGIAPGDRPAPGDGPARSWLVGAGLLVVIAASAAWSAIDTGVDPSRAYFSTFTRIHEFAIGGLLALVYPMLRPSPLVAALLRWGGTAVILACALTLRDTSGFPGLFALVVSLGTAAVSASGGADSPTDPLWRAMASRPVQWVGDASYSIYLWHWPVILLTPWIAPGLDNVQTGFVATLMLVSSLVLAALSRGFVELPTQRILRAMRPSAAALVLVLATALVALIAFGGLTSRGSAVTGTRTLSGTCVGARAALDHAACGDPFAAPAAFEVTPRDIYSAQYNQECRTHAPRCWNPAHPPKHVVALVGDSHALALYPAVAAAASARGWGVAAYIRFNCMPTMARFDAVRGNRVDDRDCMAFRDQTTRSLRELKPDLILTTGFTQRVHYRPGSDPLTGFTSLWNQWEAVAPVTVVRDNPMTWQDKPQCISPTSQAMQRMCAVPRATAVSPTDPVPLAARTMPAVRFQYVDLTRLYCDAALCHPVVGGVPVYYDRTHLNSAFSRTLAGPLGAAIRWPS